MRGLQIAGRGERLSVLCLGAHSDDIEIGAGGTLLSWLDQGIRLDVHWCVLSGLDERGSEARASAKDFLAEAAGRTIEIETFRDGFFPQQGEQIKLWFEQLKSRVNPDVILAHRGDDAHQDHREVSRLVWNTFRDHLVLEYEIPKWDGDLGRPNVFVPVSAAIMPNSHNGYYDTILELGYVGLGFLLVFLTTTVHVIGYVTEHDSKRAWLLLSIALFIMIYNFIETLWLRAFDVSWVVFVVVAVEAARYWRRTPLSATAHRSQPVRSIGPGSTRVAWRPRLGLRS